jgi:hypothetical protein
MANLSKLGSVIFTAIVANTIYAQPATTVQLPTFSRFTVQTTVSVPDGGTAYLGGIERGIDSSVTRGLGPLRSRGISSGRSTSGVSVSATIIDHAEIDRAILAAAATDRESARASTLKAREITAGVENSRVAANQETNHSASGVLPGSVAAIRAANAAQDQQRASEIAGYLARAEQAEAAGKTSVARVYYQMVARSGSTQHVQQAAQRLAALTKTNPAE